MKLSDQRILTTHVGSLPRGPRLTDYLIRQEDGDTINRAALLSEIESGVRGVVQHQIKAGVDVISDGEQSKPGFQTYVAQRMSGFGGESKRPSAPDYARFPAYARQFRARFPRRAKVANAPQAIGPISYDDQSATIADLERFRRILDAAPGFVEAFVPAPSPGIIATTLLNAHYESHEAYVFALARAMRKEYELIHGHGFLLQIDAPDLAMERSVLFQKQSDAEFLAVVELHIAALNEALTNIPREFVRLHCCWGNREGPHLDDIPLQLIMPLLVKAKVGALSIEFANPRHQHEYATLKATPLPPELALVPGVIDSTTNYVEHPQVVANRILEAVAAVGDRSRVIAGVDCGFGTFAGYEFVADDVVWEKLKACREGADIASKKLWGKAA
jgi:5-methyltetrahydropteroyltriglutamate--homocysteine methyltransferase